LKLVNLSRIFSFLKILFSLLTSEIKVASHHIKYLETPWGEPPCEMVGVLVLFMGLHVETPLSAMAQTGDFITPLALGKKITSRRQRHTVK